MKNVTEKDGQADLVTETDKAVEQHIFATLKAEYSSHWWDFFKSVKLIIFWVCNMKVYFGYVTWKQIFLTLRLSYVFFLLFFIIVNLCCNFYRNTQCFQNYIVKNSICVCKNPEKTTWVVWLKTRTHFGVTQVCLIPESDIVLVL